MPTPECRIVCTMRVANPYNYGSVVSRDLPRETVAYCETHQFEMRGLVTHTSLCPIGRIEQATALALEQIRKAGDA